MCSCWQDPKAVSVVSDPLNTEKSIPATSPVLLLAAHTDASCPDGVTLLPTATRGWGDSPEARSAQMSDYFAAAGDK